jgi:hypothetical protein
LESEAAASKRVKQQVSGDLGEFRFDKKTYQNQEAEGRMMTPYQLLSRCVAWKPVPVGSLRAKFKCAKCSMLFSFNYDPVDTLGENRHL